MIKRIQIENASIDADRVFSGFIALDSSRSNRKEIVRFTVEIDTCEAGAIQLVRCDLVRGDPAISLNPDNAQIDTIKCALFERVKTVYRAMLG